MLLREECVHDIPLWNDSPGKTEAKTSLMDTVFFLRWFANGSWLFLNYRMFEECDNCDVVEVWEEYKARLLC